MEAWRQWLLGPGENLVEQKHERFHLTATGLLMEGDGTSVRHLFAHKRGQNAQLIP
jgi:hypothetical protein